MVLKKEKKKKSLLTSREFRPSMHLTKIYSQPLQDSVLKHIYMLDTPNCILKFYPKLCDMEWNFRMFNTINYLPKHNWRLYAHNKVIFIVYGWKIIFWQRFNFFNFFYLFLLYKKKMQMKWSRSRILLRSQEIGKREKKKFAFSSDVRRQWKKCN